MNSEATKNTGELFGWRLMEYVQARNVDMVPSKCGEPFCGGDLDAAFDRVLLLDGFTMKLPDWVLDDFTKFAQSPNPVGKIRQKIVRDKTVTFSQIAESKGWDCQDEWILRKSFWASELFDSARAAEFEAHLEENISIAAAASVHEDSKLVSKLFKLKFTAIKSDFQSVGALAMNLKRQATCKHVLCGSSLFCKTTNFQTPDFQNVKNNEQGVLIHRSITIPDIYIYTISRL